MNIFEYIANLGFPVVITCYLLIVFEEKIDRLDNSIKDLIRTIERVDKNKEEAE
ncbi:MAG: YvrJ family protein [Tissierellia bacterium]|nr:YvrJ family protein [Tissierellia bacterium]